MQFTYSKCLFKGTISRSIPSLIEYYICFATWLAFFTEKLIISLSILKSCMLKADAMLMIVSAASHHRMMNLLRSLSQISEAVKKD